MKVVRKYWYKIVVMYCVLCGREVRTRKRVYVKPKEQDWIETSCPEHFI